MKDYIIRATAADGMVRALSATTTGMVREAHRVHKLSPVASAALGRTLTATALMATQLKNPKDVITVQIKGNGPLGSIVTASDIHCNVRGYVYNPEVYLPLNEMNKLDVAGAVGTQGYVNVIKDLGLKEPYVGYVDLVSGEIAEDIAYYYAVSEQTPCVVALGVLVNADESIASSGGYMLQLMPGATDEVISRLEQRVQEVASISRMLMEGETPESILEKLLGDMNIKVIDSIPCAYVCNCSRERMERNLVSLGAQELQSLIEEQHQAELQCHFCNEKYQFSEGQLRTLLQEAQGSEEESQP